MKKLNYIYCDFETTNVNIPDKYKTPHQYYKDEENPIYPKVYSWCILWDDKVNLKPNMVKDDCKVLYGIEKDNEHNFIDAIKSIDVDVIGFFNNLRGFDGHYLISMLDKAGFTYIPPYDLNNVAELPEHIFNIYTERIIRIKNYLFKNNPYVNSTYTNLKLESKEKAKEFLMKQISKQWPLLLENEYSVLTDGSTNIYEIKIGLSSVKKTGKIKRNRAIIFRDNLYLFPSSIKAMGETLIKTYDNGSNKEELIKKYSKLELSTNYTRTEIYNSLSELEQDGNELEYLIQDTYILWKFHKEMENFIPRKKWKMTIGSLAYKELIDSTGEKLLKLYLEKNIVSIKTLKRNAIRYVYKGKEYTTTGMKKFIVNKFLPCKWLDKSYNNESTMYEELQRYYNAGLVRVNEDYRGCIVKNITFIDINSSYPSIMSSLDNNVPYGSPIIGDGGKDYPFKFYVITPLKDIHNKTGLPFMFNRLTDQREYQRTLKAGTEYRITSIKYERFLKYYKCKKSDYKIKCEYSFKQIPIGALFGDYVNTNYEIKSTANNPVLKNAAKLKLNSPYGKFATKSVREFMVWNPADGTWFSDYNKTPSKYYLPLAIAITEYAQMKLVDGIGNRHDKFVYCDTDSLAIKDFKQEDFPNIEMDDTKLGAWGIDFKGDGLFRRTKQYIIKNKDKTKVAFAGINLNRFELGDDEDEHIKNVEHFKKLSFVDMILGKTINNQTRGFKLITSGVLIKTIDKTIKPVWDFPPLPEQTKHLPEHFQEDLKDAREMDKFYQTK